MKKNNFIFKWPVTLILQISLEARDVKGLGKLNLRCPHCALCLSSYFFDIDKGSKEKWQTVDKRVRHLLDSSGPLDKTYFSWQNEGQNGRFNFLSRVWAFENGKLSLRLRMKECVGILEERAANWLNPFTPPGSANKDTGFIWNSDIYFIRILKFVNCLMFFYFQ